MRTHTCSCVNLSFTLEIVGCPNSELNLLRCFRKLYQKIYAPDATTTSTLAIIILTTPNLWLVSIINVVNGLSLVKLVEIDEISENKDMHWFRCSGDTI